MAIFLLEVLGQVKTGPDRSFFNDLDQQSLNVGAVNAVKPKQPLHQFAQEAVIGFGKIKQGDIEFSAGVLSQKGFFVAFEFIEAHKVPFEKLGLNRLKRGGRVVRIEEVFEVKGSVEYKIDPRIRFAGAMDAHGADTAGNGAHLEQDIGAFGPKVKAHRLADGFNEGHLIDGREKKELNQGDQTRFAHIVGAYQVNGLNVEIKAEGVEHPTVDQPDFADTAGVVIHRSGFLRGRSFRRYGFAGAVDAPC